MKDRIASLWSIKASLCLISHSVIVDPPIEALPCDTSVDCRCNCGKFYDILRAWREMETVLQQSGEGEDVLTENGRRGQPSQEEQEKKRVHLIDIASDCIKLKWQ